jgi:hypothetical protein
VIDAHPEDVNMLDFTRPDGTRVMRTPADYRQLNDALFHAGLRSGSASEWQDRANRLHFYVIDTRKDDRGILSYTVGVRSLDGAGTQTRGVAASAPAAVAVTRSTAFDVTLTNTGGAAPVTSPSLHPSNPETAPYLTSDIYRVTASVDRPGWSATLQSALVAVKSGASIAVPVHVARPSTATAPARVTILAVSESDPAKTATTSTVVSADGPQ